MELFTYDVMVESDVDGHRAVVVGRARVWVAGPFSSRDAARIAVCGLVKRWQARAKAVGGDVWRPDGRRIGVALPAGVVPREALPFDRAPCAQVAAPEHHGSGAARPENRHSVPLRSVNDRGSP